jgi:hypothetical protein
MAGKAISRVILWVRVPIVITAALAAILVSSSVWGVGERGGHGASQSGDSPGREDSGAPSSGGGDRMRGGDHGPPGGAPFNHGLGAPASEMLGTTGALR